MVLGSKGSSQFFPICRDLQSSAATVQHPRCLAVPVQGCQRHGLGVNQAVLDETPYFGGGCGLWHVSSGNDITPTQKTNLDDSYERKGPAWGSSLTILGVLVRWKFIAYLYTRNPETKQQEAMYFFLEPLHHVFLLSACLVAFAFKKHQTPFWWVVPEIHRNCLRFHLYTIDSLLGNQSRGCSFKSLLSWMITFYTSLWRGAPQKKCTSLADTTCCKFRSGANLLVSNPTWVSFQQFPALAVQGAAFREMSKMLCFLRLPTLGKTSHPKSKRPFKFQM